MNTKSISNRGSRAGRGLNHVEVTGIVESGREDLFQFTDWCYNDSVYDSQVKEARIVKLPDSKGMGKVTHYVGNMMGCHVEWEGESIAWKKNEYWAMKATKGLLARLSMQAEMRFEDAGPRRTKVTFRIDYRVPYLILGTLMDRLLLRRQIWNMAKTALEGLSRAASFNEIPSLAVQIERRREDNSKYLSEIKEK